MQADIRIVADDAKYAIPQVRRGVVPDMMSHWTVARVAGLAVAADVLLTGRTFDGPEAVRRGAREPVAARRPGSARRARHGAGHRDQRRTDVGGAEQATVWGQRTREGFAPREVAGYETELHHRVMAPRTQRRACAPSSTAAHPNG